MMRVIDLLVSLVLTALISVGVKTYFGDSGLSAFPVLAFLVILVLSYMATAFVHSLIPF